MVEAIEPRGEKDVVSFINPFPSRRLSMGGGPRITNRERVLLALADAPDFEDQYELPRRFSQIGLSQRLGMAQSHVSRALGSLLADELLVQKRKRVVGERRRVTTYSLSEKGVDRVYDLSQEIENTDVLSTDVDGTLRHLPLRKLVDSWSRSGHKQYPDALSLADLLKSATMHDGLPMLEGPPEADAVVDEDISSEAIGLHLELAELRRSQGDLESAFDHLKRAANLHFKRGDTVGQVRCILAAASLGATVDNPESMVAVVAEIKEPTERMDAALMLHDALLPTAPEIAAALMAENIPSDHPEAMLRATEASLRRGGEVSLHDIPEWLPGAQGLRQNLWRGSLLRLKCRLAARDGRGWPTPTEVTTTLTNIGPDSRHPHTLLYGELVLAHLNNPVISDLERRDMLSVAWGMRPPMPTAGHIGFQLVQLLEPAESMVILIELQQRFNSSGDAGGAAVCAHLLETI